MFKKSQVLFICKGIEIDTYKTDLMGCVYSNCIALFHSSCICKSVDDRPDTVELASQIADKLLVHVDNLRINQITLEKKLEKERKKAQRYNINFFEAKY